MEKATRQQTKRHNTNLTLKTIYQQVSISRADIARATNLTRTTVSDIVAELLDEGLVAEIGMGSSQGGKPPIQVSLVEDARHLICLDLRKDLTYAAAVNLRGQVVARRRLPLQQRMGDQALQVVYQLLDELVETAKAPLLGIGIGTPGVVDTQRGIVRQAVNRGWIELPLKDLLARRYHLPVHVANDSHIAALAEYTYGQHNASNLVLVDIGEGIGSGIVLNGQIHPGDGFSAGEIGHLVVEKNGTLCSCGNPGCLETIASSRALLEQARHLAVERRSPFLALEVPDGDVQLAHLYRAFKAGDPAVTVMLMNVAGYVGTAIASLVGVLNINKLILSGDVTGFGERFLTTINAELQKRVLPSMAADAKLSFSRLGDEIVILGAAALLLLKELGLP